MRYSSPANGWSAATFIASVRPWPTLCALKRLEDHALPLAGRVPDDRGLLAQRRRVAHDPVAHAGEVRAERVREEFKTLDLPRLLGVQCARPRDPRLFDGLGVHQRHEPLALKDRGGRFDG